MAFRLTPEEHAIPCERIALSGLDRQEYIYRKLMDMEVVVQALCEGSQGPEGLHGANLSAVAQNPRRRQFEQRYGGCHPHARERVSRSGARRGGGSGRPREPEHVEPGAQLDRGCPFVGTTPV